MLESLTMHIFKYHSFTCEVGETLETRLNELGAQGWRLHTCEPIRTMGPAGSGPLEAFVVMDMLLVAEDEDQHEEPQSEGLAMKG